MFESVTKAILAHKNIVVAAVAIAALGMAMVPVTAPAQAQFIGLFDYNPQINENSVDQDADQKVKGDSASGSISQSADTTQSNSHTGGTVNITSG